MRRKVEISDILEIFDIISLSRCFVSYQFGLLLVRSRRTHSVVCDIYPTKKKLNFHFFLYGDLRIIFS